MRRDRYALVKPHRSQRRQAQCRKSVAKWGFMLCDACFAGRYGDGRDWRPQPYFGTVAELRAALDATTEEAQP
mgnify:CR=1 FL=1